MSRILAIGPLVVVLWCPLANAEPARPTRVVIEASNSEISAPGLLGLTVTVEDARGRPIAPRRLAEVYTVAVAMDGVTALVEVPPSNAGSSFEGELRVRSAGRHAFRGRVVRDGETLLESEPVFVDAVASIDFGVVKAGETLCKQLPGGGRGVLGKVRQGTLPSGLRLWGGCLVADDDVEKRSGRFRAEIAVQVDAGAGRRRERRFYDIAYSTEPRLVTPRRVFIAVSAGALFGMVLFLGLALRSRRLTFDSDTLLAWTRLESSPYRGGKVRSWQAAEVGQGRHKRRIDVGEASGELGRGVLRVKPTEGLVEFIGPASEELRAKTVDGRSLVGRRRLSVPYGSVVTFRSTAVALLMGDEAAAMQRGVSEFLESRLADSR